MKFAIVVLGYNRVSSLVRLLRSLATAEYGVGQVDLIVSIDYSDKQQSVANEVRRFRWPYGSKKIRALTTKHGLRSHVLLCGDWADRYDAIVMLEDDLFVSKAFFSFVSQAVKFYAEDARVAGFSLYAPAINEMVEKPFVPFRTQYDVYALQSAQSWGQCWTRSMWASFRTWYESNRDILRPDVDMPSKIYSWPDTSWKKYYMKYLVETNRYFIYPYESLSTNASEMGAHHVSRTNSYQVPLLGAVRNFRLGQLDNLVSYDIFFEREGMVWTDEDGSRIPVCLDLYGSRVVSDGSRMFLTKKVLPFKPVAEFDRSFRPHEVNYELGEKGKELRLYDLGESGIMKVVGRQKIIADLDYHVLLPWKYTLIHGIIGLLRYISSRVRSVFGKIRRRF